MGWCIDLIRFGKQIIIKITYWASLWDHFPRFGWYEWIACNSYGQSGEVQRSLRNISVISNNKDIQNIRHLPGHIHTAVSKFQRRQCRQQLAGANVGWCNERCNDPAPCSKQLSLPTPGARLSMNTGGEAFHSFFILVDILLQLLWWWHSSLDKNVTC